MNTKTLLLFWLTFLMPFIVIGQNAFDNDYINRSLQDFASKMQLYGTPAGTPGYSKVEGSEFMDDNFEKGDIFTVNSEHFSEIPMRYNAYYDNVEVQLPNGTIYKISDPKLIFQIRIKENYMVYTSFMSPDGEKEGYLSLLYEGKSALYRRNSKIFRERVPSNGILNEVPAKIVDVPKEYYVRSKEKNPRFINSKKDLLLLYPDHSSQLETFFKKEKLKTNNDEDLIKAVTYCDSL